MTLCRRLFTKNLPLVNTLRSFQTVAVENFVLGAILGSIAIVISLMALWFVAEVLKRMDARSDGLIRPHLKSFKSRLSETNRRVSDLEMRLAQVETLLSATRLESRAARDLAEETRVIRNGLRRSRIANKRTQAYHA